MLQERAATDAGRLRLDQRLLLLHGDGGIHRAAAPAQEVEARLGGEGVGRRDHVMGRERGLARLG